MISVEASVNYGSNQSVNAIKKIDKGLRKLRGTFQVTSRGEQQLHYEIPSKLHKYYSTTHRELYGRKHPNPLESFMSTVHRHIFSKF